MKVSIMMCSYNSAEFIERALDSIIAQTYQDWELIISDDASQDNTVEIIKPYLKDARIKLIIHEKNKGYVRNKNFSFTQATGELLTQLDADDTCPPERIELQVAAFLNNPGLKICGSNYQQIDLNDKPLGAKIYANDFLIEDISLHYPFWYPGLMIHRSLVDEFGLFSEYFLGLYGDDYHLTVRINKKYPIYFIKESLYNYRINHSSVTNMLDNPRKLIVNEILTELYRQQKEGTDWLEQGQPEKLLAFEKTLLNNRELMSEKYRIWAAKAIDKKDFKQGRKLLRKSFKLQLSNRNSLKTALYFIRRRFLS